jgi:hypothetical protein
VAVDRIFLFPVQGFLFGVCLSGEESHQSNSTTTDCKLRLFYTLFNFPEMFLFPEMIYG